MLEGVAMATRCLAAPAKQQMRNQSVAMAGRQISAAGRAVVP